MNNLEQLVNTIKNQRNRVIIINQKYVDKYRNYFHNNNIELINLSLTLSGLLTNLEKEEREHEAWDILKGWMDSQEEYSGDILAFYDIDYMFSPEVGNLDPIKNFNYYSRDKQIIILFINARKVGNLLIYSSEGSPDYNEMDISMNDFVLGWETED